ncbi:MAG: hypothetical protein Kow0025_02580 [Thermodesulfovibrionales bacterium]
MAFRLLRITLLIAALAASAGCSAPPAPPELGLAERQELDLWRAGAGVYAPAKYAEYKAALRKAREGYLRERERFPLLRKMDPVEAELKAVLEKGGLLMEETAALKEARAAEVEERMALLENSVENLGKLTSELQRSRLARRDLVKAQLLISEARLLKARHEHPQAAEKLREAERRVEAVKRATFPLLVRYADKRQIEKWRRWAAETIEWSGRTGGKAIVVNKMDRTLTLYRDGAPIKTYGVGLGRNGANDKLHAGDGATPEGRYSVSRKNPNSRYHLALLINYPNDEDRRNFAQLRKKGLIPAGKGIGGLVEIHGGGKESLTHGCIALENSQMEELYSLVEVGTPVTIVGALEPDNPVSALMKGL